MTLLLKTCSCWSHRERGVPWAVVGSRELQLTQHAAHRTARVVHAPDISFALALLTSPAPAFCAPSQASISAVRLLLRSPTSPPRLWGAMAHVGTHAHPQHVQFFTAPINDAGGGPGGAASRWAWCPGWPSSHSPSSTPSVSGLTVCVRASRRARYGMMA